MEEIWRDIEGYEGKYMVSNMGRVKSLNYRRTGKEKILIPGKTKRGYLHVVLCSNNKQKNFLVHRLVSKIFLDNPNNLPQVNHKDENKLNNCVDNLEWCDNRYNLCYGTRLERVSKILAKKVGCYKEGKLIKIYNSIIDTKKDDFNYSHVCSCCNGNRKSHAGFNWRYID